MKRTSCITALIIIIWLLCSCSTSTKKDTFFVHSVCFDSGKNGLDVIFLLEKQRGDSNEYFTASYRADSIKDAADKLSSDFDECYFATSDLYFISSTLNSDTISQIARDICDSNIYPTTGSILCISLGSARDFMDNIKNEEVITKIKKDAAKKKVNAVSFFAKYDSGIPISIDSFSLNNGKISKQAKATFHKGRKAVSDGKNKQ